VKYAELHRIYHQPFFDLLKQARAVHDEHWTDNSVQLCTLLSIKTGGCSEDCGYCAQSARYTTGVQAEKLMPKEQVMERASPRVIPAPPASAWAQPGKACAKARRNSIRCSTSCAT
jgi:biotin synthase-like enzyme